MRDMAALHTAFGGCGTTLAEAQRRTGTNPRDMAATLDLLGELLMVAGTRCIPGPTRITRDMAEEAKRWPRLSAEEQLAVLRMLMGMLANPPEWRKTSTLPSSQKPMLPREMGAWDGPNDMPSCFGMMVILASFGYGTNTPMLTASVQRVASEVVAPGLEALYASALKFIDQTLPLARQYDDVCVWMQGRIDEAKESQHLMRTAGEFHGAVVLRLSDGRWVSLDPYMQNMSILTHSPDNVAPRLLSDPIANVTVLGATDWAVMPGLDQDFSHASRGVQHLYAEYAHGNLTLFDLAAKVQQAIVVRGDFKPLSIDEILQRATKEPAATTLPSVADARARVQAAENASSRRLVAERILLSPLRVWAAIVWQAAVYTRKNEPHKAMMLSAPKRRLGVSAIINLRHRMRPKKRPYAADLLPYSGSDATLYNAFQDRRKGLATPAEVALLEQRLLRYRQSPRELFHPLILEVLDL